MIARVSKGDKAGDYRRDLTDYGAVFWRNTRNFPGAIPVTDATMQLLIKRGHAEIVNDSATPEPIRESKPPSADDVDLDDLDIGEQSWYEEILEWSRSERRQFLKSIGWKMGGWMSKSELAKALIQLRRQQYGRTNRKAPGVPNTSAAARQRPKEPPQSDDTPRGRQGDGFETAQLTISPSQWYIPHKEYSP